MPIVAAEFLLTLEKEASLVRQFVTLLEKEQTILTEGDTEELPALAAHKEQLAETLTNSLASATSSDGLRAFNRDAGMDA